MEGRAKQRDTRRLGANDRDREIKRWIRKHRKQKKIVIDRKIERYKKGRDRY